MRWRRLSNWPEEELWRGTVFRLLQSEWPHETPVDLMLVEAKESPSGFSLLVATGYKAGARLRQLPAAAKAKGKVRAISRAWIIRNWERKIYPQCPVESVRVAGNYAPGV
jgi:Immunity protein 45